MYKQEDIFKALQAGANPDDLVRQFTDAMNAAISQKNAEDQKKKATYAQKVARMQEIIDTIGDYFKDLYPELPAEGLSDYADANALVEEVDKAIEGVIQMQDTFARFMNPPTGDKKGQLAAAASTKQDAEMALKKFLKSNGLI